jgi:hypothetical protein
VARAIKKVCNGELREVMKSYQVLLQAPYVARVIKIFNSFLTRAGKDYESVLLEISNYFSVETGRVLDLFGSTWGSYGIKNPGDFFDGVDVLLLVIRRACDLTGLRVHERAIKRWKQYPKILRKGMTSGHVAKLKVRVKKMSTVWKAEG